MALCVKFSKKKFAVYRFLFFDENVALRRVHKKSRLEVRQLLIFLLLFYLFRRSA